MKLAVIFILVPAMFYASGCTTNISTESQDDGTVLSSYADEGDEMAGTWVQPNPINSQEVQGFQLNSDGTALSVNMATLIYKNWWVEGDSLKMKVESVGNKVSFVDTLVYQITRFEKDTLALSGHGRTDVYSKLPDGE
jgi:hypothetical protein